MSKRILIVEDEQNIIDILAFNLQREGYETIEVMDGALGLEAALEHDPDLILLDLMLPGMDGFEVCRRLREQERSTPIIMLTAREEETDKVLGLELGADDYITKPFSMRELLARIQANIRRTDMNGTVAPVLENIMEDLGCGHEKAGKLLADLERHQLLHRVRQGLCKPDRLYPLSFLKIHDV